MQIDRDARRGMGWLYSSLRLLVLLTLTAAGRGCDRSAAPAVPPAPAVTVSRPVQRDIADWDEYPGRLSAVNTVDVRARVSGFLEKAPFDEGAIIKEGDVLFVLDVRPFQAELDRTRAMQAQAEAQQRFAESEYNRMKPLYGTGAVAETQFLSARQAMETANAAVEAAKAAVEQAQLNLDWCRVTAPIAGRVGRKLVTVGNLITGGTAMGTLLTTITTLDPIYCYADVDERSILRYRELVRANDRSANGQGALPAQLAVGSGDFEYQGHIDFVNNQIDPQTGTISIRGVFSNHDGLLLPGLYARLRILTRGPHPTLLVPEGAIGSTLAQQYVLVVGPDNVVQYRPVTPGRRFGTLREAEGLNAEDRVVIDGIVNLRPGTHVTPREVPPEVAATQASQPAPSAQPVGVGQGPSRSSNGPANAGGGAGTGGTSGGATGGGGAGAGSGGAGVGGGGRP